MSFADILADVYTLTGHSELVALSKLGIRAATVKLHGMEFWREDRVEENITVSVADSQFSIDLSAALSYPVRHIEAIKKLSEDVYFDEIDPKQLLDQFGFRRYNTYYRIGNTLTFLTDSSETEVYFIYYKQPVATETGYSSWIADTYPLLIALEAANFVFSSIGDKEQEAKIKGMIAEHIGVLTINHLDTVSSNS